MANHEGFHSTSYSENSRKITRNFWFPDGLNAELRYAQQQTHSSGYRAPVRRRALVVCECMQLPHSDFQVTVAEVYQQRKSLPYPCIASGQLLGCFFREDQSVDWNKELLAQCRYRLDARDIYTAFDLGNCVRSFADSLSQLSLCQLEGASRISDRSTNRLCRNHTATIAVGQLQMKALMLRIFSLDFRSISRFSWIRFSTARMV